MFPQPVARHLQPGGLLPPPLCSAVVTSVQQDEEGVVVATADGVSCTAPFVVRLSSRCLLRAVVQQLAWGTSGTSASSSWQCAAVAERTPLGCSAVSSARALPAPLCYPTRCRS